jgi:hypothetical protein
MKLAAGKYYVSRDGFVWCCYRFDPNAEEHACAHCIRVADDRIEYFYEDGRYEEKGEREHTLVRRIQFNYELKTPARDPVRG